MRENDRVYDACVVGGQVVMPPLGVFELNIAIGSGRIVGLLDPHDRVEAGRVIDARGKLVFPGLIDPHTHIGYEGPRGMPLDALASQYETETLSALVGGVTTLINTYRNDASYSQIFEAMRSAGEQASRIDFAYSLGITNNEQLREIPRYYAELGVSSFKFYMAYRGEDAIASGNVSNQYDDGLLYEGMKAIAKLPGGLVMVHPENIEIINRLRKPILESGRTDLAAWTESRPDFTEAENIRRALYLADQTGCPLYVPHLSCRRGLEVCLEHRALATTPVYCEVCPHYLTHTKDSDLGVLGKVNPPLREPKDQEALWEGLALGVIDSVGSDHAGVARAWKGPTIWQGTPGFAGIATILPVLLNGVHENRLSILDVALATSYRPARIFNLFPRKGTLMVGSDADLSIVDLDLEREVSSKMLQSRSDFTIYEGWKLRGWPVLTMVRGEVLMENGEVHGQPGYGHYLSRS